MHYQQRNRLAYLMEHRDMIPDSLCELSYFQDPNYRSEINRANRLSALMPDPPPKPKKFYPEKIDLVTPPPEEKTFPSHPDNWPQVTPPDVFNRHMSQALTPYAISIVSKIAEDRKLKPPDAEAVAKALDQVNWAQAAYEMRGLGKEPPQGKLSKFIDKYILDPIDKVAGGAFNKFWPLFVSAKMIMVMYHMVGVYMDKFSSPVSAFGDFRLNKLIAKTTGKAYTQLGVSRGAVSRQLLKTLIKK